MVQPASGSGLWRELDLDVSSNIVKCYSHTFGEVINLLGFFTHKTGIILPTPQIVYEKQQAFHSR